MRLEEKRDMAACRCDFCTGKKRWSDNWCPMCGEVKLSPPKWWENLDVCDACERQADAENHDPGDEDRSER